MHMRVLSKVLRADSNRLSLLSKHFIAALNPSKEKKTYTLYGYRWVILNETLIGEFLVPLTHGLDQLIS